MSQRPRVLISGPMPPPHGGIAAAIQHAFDSEVARHFELVRHATSVRRYAPRGFAGRALDAGLARAFGFDGAANLEARAQLAAWRAALEPRPDLVHLHSFHGWDFWLSARMARAARRRGIPALHQVHGNFDVFYPTWSALRRAGFHRALRAPDRVVVLSEGWKRWFAAHMDPARIEVLPNCVDVHRFRKRDFDAPRDALRLLFVGTRDPELKGAHDVLAVAPEILRAVPEARFVFVGDDPERIEERFVRGTPLAERIAFAGLKTPDEMVACFAEADVLLLPSQREAMPVALLEAMASGLPVVASAVGAIPEVLDAPAGGVLIPPRDRAALARGILALARDPEWRARAGAANRARALRDFDRARFAERLEALYRRALRERR